MNSLQARRVALIAEVNRQIVKVQTDPEQKPELTARMSRLLNRIQRINERLDTDVETSIHGILEQQDALAEQVFGDGRTGPQVVAEINRVTDSIEDFALKLASRAFYYAAA
ncbi:hypothetical protein [Larkinella sp.]|uniref:hypothetical protein n=1 Tax=Larkinella sp. TaxID=2034517 RepID=UPI003BAA17A3